MKFQIESLIGDAMQVFKDRVITVLCNSPLHAEEVAVIELCTNRHSWEGAIKLCDLVMFAGLTNVHQENVLIREKDAYCMELWLFAPRTMLDFDDDPTPVL